MPYGSAPSSRGASMGERDKGFYIGGAQTPEEVLMQLSGPKQGGEQARCHVIVEAFEGRTTVRRQCKHSAVEILDGHNVCRRHHNDFVSYSRRFAWVNPDPPPEGP